MHKQGRPADLRTRALLIATGVAIATFIVYLPSLGSSFVNWDDPGYVYKNTGIRSFDLKWLFTAEVVGNWHPLTLISLVIDYAIWGLKPFGYHLTNSILHAVNALLASLLAVRLYSMAAGERSGSSALMAGAVAGLLFGVHPQHVESVAWISERKDVLCALFFLLSIVFYLKYNERRARWLYGASLISFILALMSKPMAVSLPIVLLILDFYPLERFRGGKDGGFLKAFAEKIPFYALSTIFSLIAIWAQRQSEAFVTLEAVPFTERIAVALRAISFYLYKMALPFGLAPFYPRPAQDELFNYAFMVSLAVFAALTAAAVLSFRRKLFTAVWVYYIITLIPVLGIVQVGTQAAADRYMYLPALGPFMLLGAGAAHIFGKGKKAAFAMAAVTVIASAALSVLTIRQTKVWKDSISLWSYEIGLYPERVPLAYTNRGIAYGLAGRVGESIGDFTSALRINPRMVEAYYNRAVALSMLGKNSEAIEDLSQAIRIKPSYADAYHNRAVAYGNLADYGAALEDFKKAIELDPGNGGAYMNLGLLYLRKGDKEEAAAYLERALTLGVAEAGNYLRNLRQY